MRLIAYSSSESGGMMGGYSSTNITYTEDGRCQVNISNRPFHSQPLTHVKYYADGLLEKLSEVCERYNVISWTDLPEQKIIMLDAANNTDNFTFEDGTKIVLGSRIQYPEHASEMYEEFNKIIRESEGYGVDREVTEEEPFMSMEMMAFQVDKPVKDQTTAGNVEDTSIWARFCVNCGAEFIENQKFCAECGSVRPKQ